MSTFFADKSLMGISSAGELETQMRRADAAAASDDPEEMGEVGSVTGGELDDMSAVTMPSVEEYHILDWKEEKKEEKNLGKKGKKARMRRKANPEGEDDDAPGAMADMRSNEARASVVPLEVRTKLAKQNEEKRILRKEFLPEVDDFYKPKDVIILCFAMVSGHGDLDIHEKELANKWLHIWDDGSRRYSKLVRRGISIGGL
jgi:hypothetical protein